MVIGNKIWKFFKPERKYYHSIDFLPVWNFYQVIERQDSRYLFKLSDYEILPNEFPPPEVWSSITEQYSKECIGVKYFQYRTMKANIIQLRNKFMIVSNALYALSFVKDEKLIDVIVQLGYPFDNSSEDAFANSLISISQKLKGLKKSIELKELEFDKTFSSKEKRQDLYDVIGSIEQWKQFKIDIFSLTVRQFLYYQKKYAEEVNRLKARQFSKEVSHG
jgi:hypothetical protein